MWGLWGDDVGGVVFLVDQYGVGLVGIDLGGLVVLCIQCVQVQGGKVMDVQFWFDDVGCFYQVVVVQQVVVVLYLELQVVGVVVGVVDVEVGMQQVLVVLQVQVDVVVGVDFQVMVELQVVYVYVGVVMEGLVGMQLVGQCGWYWQFGEIVLLGWLFWFLVFEDVEGGQCDWVDVMGLQCIECVGVVLGGGDYWVGVVGVVVFGVLYVQYVEVQQVVGVGWEVDVLYVFFQLQVVMCDWFVLFFVVVVQVYFVIVYLVVFLVFVVVWCDVDVIDYFVFVEVDYLFVCIGVYGLVVYVVELGVGIVIEGVFQCMVGFFGWVVDYQQVVCGQFVVQYWCGWVGIIGGCGSDCEVQLQLQWLVDVLGSCVYMQCVVVFLCVEVLVFSCIVECCCIGQCW